MHFQVNLNSIILTATNEAIYEIKLTCLHQYQDLIRFPIKLDLVQSFFRVPDLTFFATEYFHRLSFPLLEHNFDYLLQLSIYLINLSEYYNIYQCQSLIIT